LRGGTSLAPASGITADALKDTGQILSKLVRLASPLLSLLQTSAEGCTDTRLTPMTRKLRVHLAFLSLSRRERAGVRGFLSALDDDNVCLNLAVHISSPAPLGDRFRGDVGRLAESRGVAGLDLVP
jgi:hypothetical protein